MRATAHLVNSPGDCAVARSTMMKNLVPIQFDGLDCFRLDKSGERRPLLLSLPVPQHPNRLDRRLGAAGLIDRLLLNN
jgi:hypothetical protein